MPRYIHDLDIEQLIRCGKLAEARVEIEKKLKHRLLRHERVKVAEWCWRSGMPEAGARLLHPVLKGMRSRFFNAFQTERLEYAQCLVRLGGFEEAWHTLSELNGEDPNLFLYRAFCLISQWRYREAIPLLREVNSRTQKGLYIHIVSEVNLAAALVFEGQRDEAVSLLGPLCDFTKEKGFRLLYGNCQMILAQCHLEARNWRAFDAQITQAKEAIESRSSLDRLLIDKWDAIGCLLRSDAQKKQALKRLELIKRECGRWHLWEARRQIDVYIATAVGDTELLHHVYFGTPFEAFRQKLEGVLESRLCEDFSYHPELAPRKSSRKRYLIRPPAEHGSLLQRLFLALIEDFYRPIRMASLYSKLYPGEYFNPTTAPGRVYEAVHRLNRLFLQEKIPLQVGAVDSAYKLIAKAKVTIPIRLHKQVQSRGDLVLMNLKTSFSETPFSTDLASRQLKLPYRSTFRLLQSGVEKRLIERIGSGKNTRYKFVA